MPTAATPTPTKPLPPEDLDHVLAHTRHLWPEARGQSFFITGGTGFFGMWLLETLAHANDTLALDMRATILTRDPAAFAQKAPHLARRPDLTLIPGDIRDFPFPTRNSKLETRNSAAVGSADGAYPYIIHAATPASAKLNADSPREMLDTILAGTRRLLDFAALPATRARKLLLTSSGAVYGRQPPDLTHIPETHPAAPDPLDPANAYAIGKLAAEHMTAVDAARHGYEAKIARCFAFVGPHLPLDTHFAIGNFIRDALAGRPIHINGDGTPYRSYLYAADLAIWLWTILFRGAPSRAYNTGSPDALPIAELAAATTRALATRSPVHIAQPPTPGTPASRYVPDTTRARAELGLASHFDITQSIQRTARWHRAAQSA